MEAYIGTDDRASHARFGETARNRVMFGPPGIAYVYLVYGMYDCLNVVTEPAGRAGAVLIRSAEPLDGISRIRAARLAAVAARRRALRDERSLDAERRRLDAIPDRRLLAGPGLLAAGFDIDRRLTGLDLCDPSSPLRLEAAPAGEPTRVVLATPRVGVAYAGEPWASVPWRLLIAGSSAISS